MKKIFTSICMATLCLCSVNAQLNKLKVDKKRITEAAGNVVTAVTLSDADVTALTKEYVEWCDANNPLCEVDSEDPGMKAYAERLDNLTKNHANEDGMNLDIKAYYVVDQNAFACANGSIRVFAGLMDMLTDDELLGVIGHEMGHIKHGDTKAAIKQAYLTAAGKGLIASTGSDAAKLTDSQLGALGEALVGAQHSQQQEYAADDYGYDFLKRNGYDSKGMASALRKIQALQDGSGGKMNQLFSTHPESGKRAARLEELDK